jgi:two-component system, NtrC family, sensor kinase
MTNPDPGSARRDTMAVAAPSLPDLQLASLDALSDGVWIATPDGTIRYRNDAASAMERMRWTRSGVTGSMHEVVFRPEVLSRLEGWDSYAIECELQSPTIDITAVHSVDLRLHAIRDDEERIVALSLHGRDVSREWTREQALHDRHVELEEAYARLKHTQSQLLQSEKMASIGQLAAGVAHEINNPIGYVHSNLGTLQGYLASLLDLLDTYDAVCAANPGMSQDLAQVAALKRRIDYDFLRGDLPQLVSESREGIGRVKKIVLDLRDFSHAGEIDDDEWATVDLHRGIDSTLNIVWNELKYKATLDKHYAELPLVECLPSQLNQVFMNLLVNAGQAITENGHIAIRTSVEAGEVCIAISDNGAGIAPDVLPRIFDPFFTTKPIGKGTGLGLSLSYGIIQKHDGRIVAESQPGVGTTFRIYLPLQRARGTVA